MDGVMVVAFGLCSSPPLFHEALFPYLLCWCAWTWSVFLSHGCDSSWKQFYLQRLVVLSLLWKKKKKVKWFTIKKGALLILLFVTNWTVFYHLPFKTVKSCCQNVWNLSRKLFFNSSEDVQTRAIYLLQRTMHPSRLDLWWQRGLQWWFRRKKLQ